MALHLHLDQDNRKLAVSLRLRVFATVKTLRGKVAPFSPVKAFILAYVVLTLIILSVLLSIVLHESQGFYLSIAFFLV